jgi:acetyltransferase-like isoleucine patch superfamily enzyme
MIGNYTTIKDDVKLGKDTKVWHFCNLYGCKIGKNTQIGSYSEIKGGASIGNNCRIQPYAFIPEGTKIGNYVFIGPRVTFLNDKYPTAKKAIKKTWNLEAVVIEDEVTIGGNSTILPRVKIGKGAVIGAGSVVTKNIPEYAVVCGNPARIIGSVNDKKYREFRK